MKNQFYALYKGKQLIVITGFKKMCEIEAHKHADIRYSPTGSYWNILKDKYRIIKVKVVPI